MRILICDDEMFVRAETKDTVLQVFPNAEIYDTGTAKDALAYAEQHSVDAALLDIEMPGMTGISLAKKLKETNPKANIIFVTAYSQYALEAFHMYASAYLLKPITVDAVKKAFANLRVPLRDEKEQLAIQCFGNFEVFYRGEPLVFARSRAKEVFAYLVELKGATATTGELCAILWEDSTEDEKNKHYLRNLLADIRKTLSDIRMEDVLIARRNSYAINPERLDCDFYRYMDGDPVAKNSYHGDFMRQYSWAESLFQP